MTQSTSLCANCSTPNRTTAKFCKVCGKVLGTSSMLLKQRYQLIKVVGQGGFGAIYQAEDIHFANHPKRAVKEMLMQSFDPQEQQQAIEAFKQEALMLAGLMHQNLPRIYEYFEEGDCWYLVMDYIDGQTLQDHIQTAPAHKLPFQRVLHFATQLCTVLNYLHNQQPPIIFRDLKPDNVMVTADDHLYLIDFGIARLFKPGQAKDTSAFGSPGYAAPEQYGKTQTTARADIYSLGATLHYLLSGLDPGDKPFQFSHLNLTQYAPAGPAIAKLIEQMLEMNEQNRPPSVQAIQQNFQRFARMSDSGVSNLLPQQTFAVPITVPINTVATVTAPLSTQFPPIPLQPTVNDYLARNKTFIDSGKYQEALALCERALKLDPSRPNIYIDKAVALNGLGRNREALDACNQAIRRHPFYALAHYTASYILLNLGSHQQAIDACDQALQLDASYTQAYINKAIALINLGRYQLALEACDQALQLDSSSAKAYNNKALALIGLGRYQLALDACNQAIQHDPFYVQAHYNASKILLEMESYQQALDACNQTLRLDSSYVKAYINKAVALINLESYPQALEACNQAIQHDPHNAAAYHNASVALLKMGSYQQAFDACEQALRFNPNYTQARMNLDSLRKKLRGW